jgi:serine/threonine protein kinase
MPDGYAIFMADLSGQSLGAYALLERIGRGGMSDVYRAESGRGDVVAVKVLKLDPEDEESGVFLARFEREARIIAELKHPHLLPILDYGQQDDHVYMVTPLITGGTLADHIRVGPLHVEAACHWLTQIADALDHAHQLQVIHRDLKPSNVLLDEAGNAYLTDFGIARLTNTTSGLTQTGNVIGTPAYMAPEQWRDEALDARTDVYGLGVMTYFMLTTRAPFEASTPHGIMYQHLSQSPPPLRDHNELIPEAVDYVVLRALAKNPADRYGAAGEFAAAMRAVLDGTFVEPPKPVFSDPPPVYGHYQPKLYEHLQPDASPRFPRWWFAGVGGLTLSLIAVAFVFLFVVGSNLLASDEPPTVIVPSPSPQPVTTPNETPLDVPRIRIDSPSNQAVVEVGEEVIIQVAAFDRQGVTRIELLRFDVTIQQVESQQAGGESPFEAELIYHPDTIGRHQLKLVAYRGDLAGDARWLTLEVR